MDSPWPWRRLLDCSIHAAEPVAEGVVAVHVDVEQMQVDEGGG